jgi:hypothetical protein
MRAEAIAATLVLKIMNTVEPFGAHVPRYGEISEAITQAANQDPLFPELADGCARTAAVLLAISYHETRWNPALMGDNGRSFGLYQIQPPTAKVSGNLLLNARDASFIAIDLVRKSMFECRARPWQERLSWYVASNGCPTHPVIVSKSVLRMSTADRFLKQLTPPPPQLPSP